MRRHTVTLMPLCVLVLAAAAACTFSTRFWEFKEDAPLRSVSAPAGFMGESFGRLMVPMSLHAGVGGLPEHLDGDYLAVAGDAPSELVILRFAQGHDLENGNLYFRYPMDYSGDFFTSGFASSAAPVPVWESALGTCAGCFVVGATGLGSIELIDMEGLRATEPLPLVSGAGLFVDSLISSPELPVRGFIVGGTDGALVLSADLDSPRLLEVPAAIPSPAEVTAVTSASLGEASMPYVAMGSMGRVYVFLHDASLPGYVLQECIEDGAAGFASSLASLDADGDGLEDLFLMSLPFVPGRYESVAVVSGERYNRPAGSVPTSCIGLADLSPPDHLLGVFGCADFAQRDVACGPGPLFGSSVAVGNLDGAGMPEIIIGAPGAEVAGEPEAGSGLIYSLDSRDGTGAFEPLSALRLADPQDTDRLGSSAAVLNIDGRDEIVLGMPGSSRILVFYCSGAGLDTSPPGDDLCRP